MPVTRKATWITPKRLPVVNIADDSGWKVYARFDVGNVAAQEVTAFITEKFFAHEGVHRSKIFCPAQNQQNGLRTASRR